MMDKYEDLIRRLEKPIARLVSFTVPPIYEPDPLHIEAADAIRELVASLRKVMDGERYERERAEKAEAEVERLKFAPRCTHEEEIRRLEADLAAARAAYLELHDFFDVEGVGQLSELYRQHCIKHASAIAAARAEGGGGVIGGEPLAEAKSQAPLGPITEEEKK